MARARAVWGIDIGQCALKALKIRQADGQIEVESADIIEQAHPSPQSEADRAAAIRGALGQFLSRNSVAGCRVVVAVPGLSSFSKFVKLPPVEPRRVPDIVRFEAEQQIPFPIDNVVWRWQTFRDPDSPDLEVGIFAMKRADVAEMLSHFAAVELTVDAIQIVPLALYNFLRCDGQVAEDGATILADVGADKTDLVVADNGRIWTRTIQIGGNNFTEALVRTFKLSFDKAEKLKHSAASSKYARQVFQAMRPVFADLVQEVQRSVGFYTSLHRETRFHKLVGLGNGFRLPGLQKFMEQNLNIPVVRIDNYNRLHPSAAVNAPALNENVLSFAVAYGLAVQGLGMAEVDTNLLPSEILRRRLWDRKRPWFAAAAAVLLAALVCPAWRDYADRQMLAAGSAPAGLSPKAREELAAQVRQVYAAGAPRKLEDQRFVRQHALALAQAIAGDLQDLINRYEKVKGQGDREEKLIDEFARLYVYRDFWLAMDRLLQRSVQAVAPDQTRLAELARFTALGPDVSRRLTADRAAKATRDDLDAAWGLMDEDRQQALRAQLSAPAAAVKALAAATLRQLGDPNAAKQVASLSDQELRPLAERLVLSRMLEQVSAFAKADRRARQVLIVEDVTAKYLPTLPAHPAGETSPDNPRPATGVRRGFEVELTGWTPLGLTEANRMLRDLSRFVVEYSKWLSSLYLTVYDQRVAFQPMRVAAAGKGAEPETTGALRPQDDDTSFRITWWIEIAGDGVMVGNVEPDTTYVLGAATLLLPHFEPPAGVEALRTAGTKVLPAGAVVTVREARVRLTCPWYRVEAVGADGKALGSGWVGGEALDNQKLVKRNP